jgi:hypothetical protein
MESPRRISSIKQVGGPGGAMLSIRIQASLKPSLIQVNLFLGAKCTVCM